MCKLEILDTKGGSGLTFVTCSLWFCSHVCPSAFLHPPEERRQSHKKDRRAVNIKEL